MTDAPRVPKRRRWLKILALVGGALVVLVLLLPWIAAPIVKGRVIAALEERVRGTVSIEELSLSLDGGFRVAGLALVDEQGRKVVAVKSVEGDLGVRKALTGAIQAEIHVVGPEVFLRQEPDGAWNIAQLARPAAEEEEEESDAATSSPPELALDFELTEGRVVVEGPQGSTVLDELALHLTLDGLELPAPFSASARVAGAAGAAGSVYIAGEVTAAATGKFAAQELRANASLETSLDLAVFAPMIASFAPVEGLSGRLDGRADLVLSEGLRPSGKGRFEVKRLELVGPRAGSAPLRIETALLALDARLDDERHGQQSLELSAEPLLRARYDGAHDAPESGAGSLGGSLVVDASLGELARVLAGWLPMQEGVALDGRLGVKADVSLALRDRQPVAATLDPLLEVVGLSARDAQGKTLDLGALASARAQCSARADLESGRASLAGLHVEAGPLRVDGQAELAGLASNAPELASAALDLSADLGALREAVAQLVDLGSTRLGGRLEASTRIESRPEGDGHHLATDLRAERIELGLPGLGPGGLALASIVGRAEFEATRALDLSGEGRFELAGLVLDGPRAEADPATIDAATLTLSAAQDAAGGGRQSLTFAAGSLVDLRWSGELAGAPADPALPRRLSGTLAAEVALDRLAELARGWLPMQAGVSLLGTLRSECALAIGLSPAGGGPLDADLTLCADGLSARDASGQELSLAGLEQLALSCQAHVDPARGSVDVAALKLAAGPLTLEGELHALGLAPGTSALPTLSETALELSVDLDGLQRAASSLADLGELRLAGRLHAKVEGRDVSGKTALTVRADGKSMAVSGGALGPDGLRLGGFIGGLSASYDPVQDRLEIFSLGIASEPFDANAKGVVERLRAPDRALTLSAEATPRPREIGRQLAGLLGETHLDGEPLTAVLEVRYGADGVSAKGTLKGAELSLARGAAAPLVQRELALDFDVGAGPTGDALDVRRFDYASASAHASAAGTIAGLAQPARARAQLELEVTAELERLLGDLGLETPASGRRTKGGLSVRAQLAGEGGRLSLSGEARVRALELTLAAAQPGEAPLVVTDDELVLAFDEGLALEALDVDLRRLAIESRLARGTVTGKLWNLRALMAPEGGSKARIEGLQGDLVYVPDRVGALLAPWLPGRLSGSEEERIAFRFDGDLAELELAALLAGTEGSAHVGLGRFETTGLALDGDLRVEVKDGKASCNGTLAANGGTIALQGEISAAELAPGEPGDVPVAGRDEAQLAASAKPTSKMTVKLKDVQANSALSPLLGLVHPAFGRLDALEKSSIAGLIDCDLDLAYDAPLTPAALSGGWQALPKAPINGRGRFGLRKAALTGSPFVSWALGELGLDASKALDLPALEFTIERGRLRYQKPWTWSFGGTTTSFTGSIGLDETLDLRWSVPITPELVERYSYLAILAGEPIELSIAGNVRSPKIEWQGLLGDLAKKAARKELERRLLGGAGAGTGDTTGAGEAASGDPQELLDQADRLWADGKKVEAAVIYKRIKDDFELSLVYLLNKGRIKERAKFKP
jgi:hypothetical protein